MLVSLTVPSSTAEDPQADPKVRTVGTPKNGEVTPDSQCEWIRRHVPLLLAKTSVQIILWNQLSDAEPHEFPHGGLFDVAGQPKQALAALSELRTEYLM